MRAVVALGVVAAVGALAGCPSDVATSGSGPKVATLVRASQAARDRKARSEARLKAEGVPYNPTLPSIADSDGIALRDPDVVAARVLALILVTARALGPQDFYDRIRADYEPHASLSPAEVQFLAQPEPTEGVLLAFKWRVEALNALAWALAGIDDLGRPDKMANTRAMVEMVGDAPEKFVRYARLRPVDEVLDQTDLAYRYHWATRDAYFHDRPMPAGLEQGVVKERHHALNWLIGHAKSAPWDEVPTDT